MSNKSGSTMGGFHDDFASRSETAALVIRHMRGYFPTTASDRYKSRSLDYGAIEMISLAATNAFKCSLIDADQIDEIGRLQTELMAEYGLE